MQHRLGVGGFPAFDLQAVCTGFVYALATAYQTLEEAVLDMGKLKVQYLTGAVNISTDIKVSTRRVMGVSLPVIETEFREHMPYYSPMGTSFWMSSRGYSSRRS